MTSFIKGIYKQSIYSGENGYHIGIIKVSDSSNELSDYIGRNITFTGYFDTINTNDNYILYGEPYNHPKYGFQYTVNHFERIKPEDKDGIISFLSSDLFKGVGINLATSIVNRLGLDALKQIIEDKTCLYQVPKISEKKIDSIYNTLIKYEESHATIVSLTEMSFTMREAMEIYNTYKNNTISIINHNIYKIMDDTSLSFHKIDKIALSLDYDPLDERRIRALTIQVIKDKTFIQGDTYLYYDEILNELEKIDNNIKEELINNSLEELENDQKIIKYKNKYFIKEVYDQESFIANKIKYLTQKKKTPYKKLEKTIEALELDSGIKYNEKQKLAIKKALEDNVLIITGGPGTGKTTIIKAIVELYRKLNKYNNEELINKIALLAPTGRASKRMSESTNFKATTIHRFLKWNKEKNEFGINEYNPEYSHLIIIDEVSMIDTYLMDSLLKGLTKNIKLILVGDINQLPSVGPGMILKDLIEWKNIETIKLDTLYRQDENSYIPILANEINNNCLSEKYTSKTSDYQFLPCEDNTLIINKIIEVCNTLKEKKYDYKRFQVMAPMYAGETGIDNLNKHLQNIFNPKDNNKKEIKYGDIIYRENDKILQLVNLPEENVYNGDIGIIKRILSPNQSKSGKNEIEIDFDGNKVIYQQKDFINIKHGYIISIHKSQGSEFEVVLLPMSNSYKRMLYRKLIYTAITRARKKLIIIGSPYALEYSVLNTQEQPRKTDLLNKLNNN